jgi:peptidoglycan L-alanyl-D-glutamate endopeptidase CwlK
MAYRLGTVSESHLVGVHPEICRVEHRAIEITEQDFGAFEGLRDLERQKKLFHAGASRTMASYHLTGDAIDNVPYIDGRLQWQLGPGLKVAQAMLLAAGECAVPMIWGAVWDRLLGSLDVKQLGEEIRLYRERYRAAHPPFQTHDGEWHHPEAFVDVPHFQRVR